MKKPTNEELNDLLDNDFLDEDGRNVILNYNNKEVAVTSISNNGYAYKYLSDELQGDRELLQIAIKEDGNLLEHASIGLRGDKDLVLPAVMNNGYALQHASDDLKNDKEVVVEALKAHEKVVEFADEEHVLSYASPEIQDLCKGKDKDPIKILNSCILAEKLQSELTQKQDFKRTPKQKI